MRYVTALTGLLLIAAQSPAAAQMYPGQDVTVNPEAAGTRVLLYPGGRYGRILPPLREPGGSYTPIHLHMPTRHHFLAQEHHAAQPHHELAQVYHAPRLTIARATARRAAAPKAAAPLAAAPPPTLPTPLTDFGDFAVARPTTQPSAPPKLEPAPRRAVQQPVSPPQRTASIEAPVVQHTAPAEVPKRETHIEAPVRHTAPVQPPPQRVASVEPSPVRTPPPARLSTPATNPDVPSGTKRGIILFAPNADDPTVSAMATAKSLASELGTALGDGTSRVQLLAYGGPRGDKSSDTRRLSLKRALVVRQVLIDQGVPAERIDVRAMGGTEDSGPLDRVDVFLKS
jgi:outer membrane protein OmpA-like peptidoglycan-associated protein